jgi:hypothetical protein
MKRQPHSATIILFIGCPASEESPRFIGGEDVNDYKNPTSLLKSGLPLVLVLGGGSFDSVRLRSLSEAEVRSH